MPCAPGRGLAWSVAVAVGLDRIVPTQHLGRVLQAAVMHDFGPTILEPPIGWAETRVHAAPPSSGRL
ncbi:hypothetical protein AB0D37_24740 [Streptomyces sp. NPDC048384]|uniref:hypothetical protein n=1 Tax=Streptomyces sp. NPDC048384 TaxID=3155487 RepID=UPI00342DD01D